MSDLTLDRRLSGELDSAAGDELDAHLAACVRCSVRYEVIARQHREFLEAAPDWSRFVERHRPRPRRRRRWLQWSAAGLAATLVCAALVVVRAPEPATRTKGAPSLGFYLKRGDRVLRGASGDVVHPGDVLRFTYSSERSAYFALLHADPNSAAIHHPLTPAATLVEAGRDVALGFGIVLDDQLGTERVFGLFCDAPVELEPLRRALQSPGRLPEVPGCQTDVLLLDKRAP